MVDIGVIDHPLLEGVTLAELEDWNNEIVVDQILDHAATLCPAEAYNPHHTEFRGKYKGKPSGQLQFHRAPHFGRLVAAGNGWGGTMACAIEVDAWMRHTNTWQKTPDGPIQAVWFAPDGAQFGALLETLFLRKCWGSDVVYKETGRKGPRLEWPVRYGGGGTLYIWTYGVSWEHRQGIEPHLVVFDETPPSSLFGEMLQRRRGNEQTYKMRFICKATQTAGLSFLAHQVYEPWLEHHKALGITDEEEMLESQLHPDYWVWTRGGVHSNPNNDAQTVEEYERRVWGSEAERETRLYGGFRAFTGSPVFSEKHLRAMLDRALEVEGDEDRAPAKGALFCLPKEAAA